MHIARIGSTRSKALRFSLVLALGLACSKSDPETPAGGGGGTTGSLMDSGSPDGAGGVSASGGSGGTSATGGTGATATGGTGATATGGTGGQPAASVCPPTLASTGPEAPEVRAQGAYPTPAGGAIADGTYHLVRFDIYQPGSVDAYKRKHTWKVAGAQIEVVTQTVGEAEKRSAGTVELVGSDMRITVTCPAGGPTTPVVLKYSSTADGFITFDENEVHVYVKQP
jgi:hypothetical protein